MRTILRCAAALALFALGACSGGGATPSPAQSTMSDAEILAIGKQAAQCVRENGVPGFPDPYVENGHLKLTEDQEREIEGKFSQQVLDQAVQACQSILDRLPDSALRDSEGGGNDQVPGPGDVEALRKFAQCMRENGLPEFPDPKADGSFPVRGTAIETEGKSDRMIAGMQACQQYWSGGLTFS
jgi:hypothetical protein